MVIEDVMQENDVPIGQLDIRDLLDEAQKRTRLATELRRLADMLERGLVVSDGTLTVTHRRDDPGTLTRVVVDIEFLETGDQCTPSSTAGTPSPPSSTSDSVNSTSDMNSSSASSSTQLRIPPSWVDWYKRQRRCERGMTFTPCPRITLPAAVRNEVHEYYSLMPSQEK